MGETEEMEETEEMKEKEKKEKNKGGGASSFIKGALFGASIILMSGFLVIGLRSAYMANTEVIVDPTEKMQEIYSVLDKNYVNEYDKELMTETMYAGMVYGVGDPYTSYMSKEQLDSFMEQTEGSYAGIGVIVSITEDDNKMTINTVFEGAPGDKAGLLPGDKIIKIDGQEVLADNYEEAISMMKGEPNTTVTLTIYRESDDSTFDAEVTREVIDVPTVYSEMLPNNIGYLKITGFDKVTTDQFNTAYKDLENNNMQGLIIDVRNNPGGLLHVVADISDQLIPEGFSVYTEDKYGERNYYYSDANQVDVPLAILVNGNSASASEVLAGAVQDTGVGVLVGEQTFGKGLVQNLFPLSDGSAMKVTIAKYYTPNGVCIDKTGLTPDYPVTMDDDNTMSISTIESEDQAQRVAALEEDTQLLKAIEVVEAEINK